MLMPGGGVIGREFQLPCPSCVDIERLSEPGPYPTDVEPLQIEPYIGAC